MDNNFKNLKIYLSEWTDIDISAWYLAIVLGILEDQNSFSNNKWVFWSENSLGNSLFKFLDDLVKIGVLLKRDEPDFQYKWNQCYEVVNK